MAQLYLNGEEINTVFDRGDKENDITFSLGWALTQSDVFLAHFLKEIFPKQNTGKATCVHLQKQGRCPQCARVREARQASHPL